MSKCTFLCLPFPPLSHFPSPGNKFSSSHACVLVVAVWCYASVFAISPLTQWGHYGPEPYGTACCIDWHAPNHQLSALSYIVCLFLFCYALPCTIIFLSYTFILLTVRGSRRAVQQHVSSQTKTTNAHSLIVKVRGYPCVISPVHNNNSSGIMQFYVWIDEYSLQVLWQSYNALYRQTLSKVILNIHLMFMPIYICRNVFNYVCF